MAESFNGSTFSHAAADQADIRSISFSEASPEIDITVSASSAHLVEAGLPKVTCTIETTGVTGLSQGAVGALAISWNDGGSESVTGVVLLSIESNGSVDTELSSTLTFAQSS